MSVKLPFRKTRKAVRPIAANANEPPGMRMWAKVLIPMDSPIMQAEIEVFSALLDDCIAIAANNN